MKALTMTLLAMLLSTASACSKDYQYPNYWGLCVDGLYKYAERDSKGSPWTCEELVILIPQDIVGDKFLTMKTTLKHGSIAQHFSANDCGYYAMVLSQGSGYGPDIDIAFYLDGIMIHTGNYQQNYCFLESGSITTNDPNAVTYEGDSASIIPGHVIIKSFNH